MNVRVSKLKCPFNLILTDYESKFAPEIPANLCNYG
jgi:hypothetical protein